MAWFRQSLWDDRPMVHACAAAPGGELQESWNWPAGTTVQVTTYSNCPEVRLTLDGDVLGTRAAQEPLVWTVPFRPGVLLAEGLRNGVVQSRSTLVTAGPPVRVGLVAERKDDLCQVTFTVEDAQGRRVPGAAPRLRFDLEGPARLLGLGNGDLTDSDPPGPTHRAYQGRGLAILRILGKGPVTLKVTGEGLADGFLRLEGPGG
jgi:beta-galactosidase